MSDNHAEELAAIVGRSLPDHYLSVLKNYPDHLRTANRAVDDSDAEGTVADVELLVSLKPVLELNLEARGDSLVEPGGVEITWPDQFLIIGESGSGDYFCIDVDGDVDGVMRFDHHAVEFEVIADTIDEFIEILTETFGDIDDLDDDIHES